MSTPNDRQPDIQFRPPGALTPVYSPNRDLVTIAPWLLRTVCEVVNGGLPKAMAAYAELEGVSKADLVRTLQALAKGLSDRKAMFAIDIIEMFKSCGYLDCPGPARVIIEGLFGQIVLAQYITKMPDPVILGYIEFDQGLAAFADAVRVVAMKTFGERHG